MNWRPLASMPVIYERARVYQQIRDFFRARSCVEVDTPLLLPGTNTDIHIPSIAVPTISGTRYLQTSPEFAMKRLLAAGSGPIYQISHAFREDENGSRHNTEFSLLEWYRPGFDYFSLMDEIESLIKLLDDSGSRFERISYHDLFERSLGIDIDNISLLALQRECEDRVPGTVTADLEFDQCLDLILGVIIEPEMRGYQFVYDYPVSQASLARVSASNPAVAERFELFFDGLELANGFSELTDAGLQRERFEQDNRRRAESGLPVYPVDETFLSALESGLPQCAGVAIGLDRLLMVLQGLDSLDQVLSFID